MNEPQRKSIFADDARRQRSCARKTKFATHEQVEERIAYLQGRKRSKRMAKGLTPYHCRFCGCWHVGHQLSGQKPKRGPHVEIRGNSQKR